MKQITDRQFDNTEALPRMVAAVALREEGLDVAGDPDISFTETHQVILNVGYGNGAKIARRLEANNVIVNY